jgi:adenylylsulfate kinase-like enzyme
MTSIDKLKNRHAIRRVGTVHRADRDRLNGRGRTMLFFAGRYGESALAQALEEQPYEFRVHACVFDGRGTRNGSRKIPEFTDADCGKSIRRTREPTGSSRRQ